MNKTTEALKLAEALENDAKEHREVSYGLDCLPERTANWKHALNCEAAARLIREALAEPVKQEPVAWINEDELPEHYPYEEMFNASTIIDGVRMFPNVKMSARSMFYGLTKDHTWLSVTESQFNKLKPEKRMKCYLTPVSVEAIRSEALEEAAELCDRFAKRQMHPAECAAAIRKLK